MTKRKRDAIDEAAREMPTLEATPEDEAELKRDEKR